MISSKELANSFIQLYKESPDKEEALVVFLKFLEEKKLNFYLPNIIRHIEHYFTQEKYFNTLILESPFEIDSKTLTYIKTKIGVAEDIPVQHIHNERLLGGFRASFQGTITDASLLYNLQALKKQLIK